jgi:hypothetical protein
MPGHRCDQKLSSGIVTRTGTYKPSMSKGAQRTTNARSLLGNQLRRAVKRPSGGSHDNVGFCNFWGRRLQQPIEYRSAASGGAPMRVRMYSVRQIVGLLVVVPVLAVAAAAQTPVSPPVHAGPSPQVIVRAAKPDAVAGPSDQTVPIRTARPAKSPVPRTRPPL